MVRTQIQLTEEQMERLKALAKASNVSLAELIRKGVSLLVVGQPEASGPERRSRALAAVGKFRSGRSDVSRNHDEHLAEAFME
jgi:hypothetical protein